MINSIGGASAAQAAYATRAIGNTETQASAEPASALATQDAQDTALEATQSAESAAAARLGDQLNAQADAARVQRAVDDSISATGDSSASTETPEAAGSAQAQASAPAAGGQPPAGSGGASAAASTLDADYIEEADTNSDKTVSDQERAVYEASQRRAAEEAASTEKQQSATGVEADARSAEIRAVYGLDDNAKSAFALTA